MLGTLTTFASAGHAGGFGLHESLIVGSTVIVVLVIIAMAVVGRQQVGVVPKGMAACFEHVFDWIDQMATDMIGRGSRQYVPLLMSFFIFILFSNWSGLVPIPVFSYAGSAPAVGEIHAPVGDREGKVEQTIEQAEAATKAQDVGFEAPTASYNTTLALAVISFLAFNWYGIQKNVLPGLSAKFREAKAGDDAHGDHGHHSSGPVGGFFNWVLHYIQPTPMLWRSMDGAMRYLLVPLLGVLFLFLNIMEEFARIVSLSLRLFGNIFGEHQVKKTLLEVMFGFVRQSMAGLATGQIFAGGAWMGVSVIIWGAALFATLLGALAGFVQAMVFMMLSLVYIAHAVADEH